MVSAPDNPWQQPLVGVQTPQLDPSGPSARVDLRHLWANVVLFVLYSTGGMLLTYLDVQRGMRTPDFPLGWIGALFFPSAIPLTLWVNWRITPNQRNRVLVSGFVALVALAVAFIPFCLLMVNFRLAVGGTL